MSAPEHIGIGRWLTGVVLLGAGLSLGFYGLYNFWAGGESAGLRGGAISVSQDSVYLDECGACHLAYPPGLLPATSWRLLLDNLDDHFGDNAELEDNVRDHLNVYLQKEALEYGKPTPFSRQLRNMPAQPLRRITSVPNFILDHRDSSEEIGASSRVIGFYSYCENCHRSAADGDFSDPEIPLSLMYDRGTEGLSD